MTLENINLAVSTVWRKESYLDATLSSLFAEYPPTHEQSISLVVARVLALQQEQKEADAVLAKKVEAEAAHSNGNGTSEKSSEEKTYVEQS